MYFKEICSAFISSFTISPIMTIIDCSVIKSQINNLTFSSSIKSTIDDFSKKKINIFRPVVIMNSVYFSTFATANISEKYFRENKLYTLFSTSLVNVLTINYKDKEYASIYKKNYKFPKVSYFLFSIRDVMTIYSCFILKKDLRDKFETRFSKNIAEIISSISAPLFIQLLTTPLHILSIDIYQRPNMKIRERVKKIQEIYKSVCLGRMLRVIPAFCVGGFINDKLKIWL